MPMSPYVKRGPVRARDLRSNIQELGFEQGVVATLEALLDEHTQDRQDMREMAQLLDQCIDHVAQMVNVGTEMQKRMDDLKRIRDQGDAVDHGS